MFKKLLIFSIFFAVNILSVSQAFSLSVYCATSTSYPDVQQCSYTEGGDPELVLLLSTFVPEQQSTWYTKVSNNTTIKVPVTPPPGYAPIKAKPSGGFKWTMESVYCLASDCGDSGVSYPIKVHKGTVYYVLSSLGSWDDIDESETTFYYAIKNNKVARVIPIFDESLKGLIVDGKFAPELSCKIGTTKLTNNNTTVTPITVSSNTQSLTCNFTVPSGWVLHDNGDSNGSIKVTGGAINKSYSFQALPSSAANSLNITDNFEKEITVNVEPLNNYSLTKDDITIEGTTKKFTSKVKFHKSGAAPTCPDGTLPGGANGDECPNSCKNTSGTGVYYVPASNSCGCTDISKTYNQSKIRCEPNCGYKQLFEATNGDLSCKCQDLYLDTGAKCSPTEAFCDSKGDGYQLKNGQCVCDDGWHKKPGNTDKCVPIDVVVDECSTNSDCSAGKICKSGTCYQDDPVDNCNAADGEEAGADGLCDCLEGWACESKDGAGNCLCVNIAGPDKGVNCDASAGEKESYGNCICDTSRDFQLNTLTGKCLDISTKEETSGFGCAINKARFSFSGILIFGLLLLPVLFKKRYS